MAIIPKTHLWQNRVPTTTCWLGEVKAFVSFWECLLLNRTNTWTVKSAIDWLSCVDAEWNFPEEMFAHQLTSNTFTRLPSDQPHERRLRRACTMWHLGIDMEICVNWVLFLLVEISSPIVERLSTISLSRFAPFERRKKYKVILSFVFFFFIIDIEYYQDQYLVNALCSRPRRWYVRYCGECENICDWILLFSLHSISVDEHELFVIALLVELPCAHYVRGKGRVKSLKH